MSESAIGKIIVVDDEVELKNALVEALASQSFEVCGFINGHDALAALREADFDLLLSDLMMLEMDGIELVQSALEIDRHLVAMCGARSHAGDFGSGRLQGLRGRARARSSAALR